MPDYVKMADKLGATVGFLELLKLESNEKVYDELNIFNEKNPNYNDFVRVLKNPIFKSDKCTINDEMLNLKPVSLIKRLKFLFNV